LEKQPSIFNFSQLLLMTFHNQSLYFTPGSTELLLICPKTIVNIGVSGSGTFDTTLKLVISSKDAKMIEEVDF